MLPLGMFSKLTERDSPQNSVLVQFFVVKSSSKFAFVTRKKSSLRPISVFTCTQAHTKPEATGVRTTSDGQIKPQTRHMWCRCLPNAQMRALADAETYVSGEICVKCKHREQSAPRTSEHLCFCAFQSQ